MKTIPEAMKAYLETHPFDSGSDDCATVLDQLYLAYANAHESDPPEIRKGFEELEVWLDTIAERLSYKAWYCGHWHINKRIDKMHFLFDSFETV